MQQDKPLLGVTLMLGFCAMAPLGDSMAKMLGGEIGLLQLIFIRFSLQLIFLAPIFLLRPRSFSMSSRVLRLMIMRTVLHILGIGMMFSALTFLPLADAVAIAFVMPFISLLLGHFILKEEVGPRRLIASIVGFLGTLLVVQPAFQNVGWPALLPLGVAVVFALFMLVTRQMAKEIDPIAMQVISGGMAVVFLGPLLIVFNDLTVLNLAWTWPQVDTWLKILLMGIFGTGGHLLMTWSLRFAPSATLAPMQYLEIPFAALIGWVIFRDFPNSLALVGISVTVASGLYIVFREQATRRATGPAPLVQPAAHSAEE